MTTVDTTPLFDAAPSPVEPPTIRFAYRARGDELFLIWIKNLFLTLVTLGVYFPWARAQFLRYTIGHLEVDGDPLAFHGEGGQMFRGLIKAILIYTGLVGLFFLGTVVLPAEARFVASLLLYAGFIVVSGFALIGSFRYRLRHTSWRGVRFAFHGETRTFVKEFALHTLLVAMTFGFGTPLFVNWRRKALTTASALGTRRFDYTGEGPAMMGTFFLAVMFTLPTLGLIWLWYDARMKVHLWNHTWFDQARFRLDLKVSDYFVLQLQNALLAVVTLGIAWPWILVRTGAFIADRLTLVGVVDFATIRQKAQDAGATGEELAEMFDVDIGLG
jgi:uncharacterized membrane protein YjgN (DUF898 family)